MRRQPLTWVFVLMLLLVAGVWLFIHSNRATQGLKAKLSPAVQFANAWHSIAHRTASAKMPTVVTGLTTTNKLAWRLSNTSDSIRQLAHNPHAILLENAFIDTSASINLKIPKNLQSQGDPGAYVVQARGPISAAFRTMLAAAGASAVSYIPNNAYLVQATEGVANSLAANPMVQAVIPYEPYYKVQAPLLALAQQPLPANVQLNLGLFENSASATLQQIQQLGGIIVSEEQSPAGYPIVRVEPPPNWTAIARLPGVHIVEPYLRRTIANDLSRPMLGVAADSITPTNYFNLYGSNVIVELNDDGVDTNHPDFSNNHATAPRVSGFPTNTADDGHGTHTAGIIAGDGFESTTVTNASGSFNPGTNAQYRGKAPFARVVSVDFLDDDLTLQEKAATNNALISNNSWNYSQDYDYDLAAASYDAATRDALPFTTGAQPVLFVFSAGNDGNGGISGTIDSPGTAKDIITVGALEELRYITNQVTNADGTVSQPWLGETDDSSAVPGFSSCGNVGIGTEGTYGRFKPDVVAPGTFVVSCRSSLWDTNAYYNPTNNNYYDFPDDVPTNSYSVSSFGFLVPSNAVEVIIYPITNAESPLVLPPLPIYVSTNGNPFADYGTNYPVEIAPSPGTLNTQWSVEVSNTAPVAIAYDLIVDVLTTNDFGNYYQVLESLNNNLGTQPEYYRYESGTSMAAAGISGFLALIQDYFTNQFSTPFVPSPALLKAMTINGARVTSGYNFQVDNTLNPEGWGLPDLSNSVPVGLTNEPVAGDIGAAGPDCSTYFRDQDITNALATGDSETFDITINPGDYGSYLPFRATLAWTDPPGDPSAAIKLVNSLELVVTDLDNPGIVFYGNDIAAGQIYNTPENPTNTPPVVDNINNIQNVFIDAPLDTHYSVTVLGRSVNVNAVAEQTNNDVQDFALVLSSGDMGEITDAFSVVDGGVISNPTGYQNISTAQTNTVLLNQTAGANTPLLGTNTIPLGAGSEFTIGMTNQWHFYIVTNLTTFTNAAFITFDAQTLAIPRMGVYANSLANSTTPGADIDLLVARSSTDSNAHELTNLWPGVVSNCLYSASGDGSSLVSGGTDFVAYTNAVADEVYYIGVKSESHQAIQYDFIPIFSQNPFAGSDTNGNAYLNGLNVPQTIPDGTSARPGMAYVFLLDLNPIEIQNVIITNTILHQNFGDLVGSITHGGKSVVLNNHDSLPNPPGPYQLIYDAEGTNAGIPDVHPVDGPGSLQSFINTSGQGVWQLTEEGTALYQTGIVENVKVFLEKHQDLRRGITVVVQPGQWYYNYVDVPNGVTNLQIFGTNLTETVGTPPMQMYLNEGVEPTATAYNFEVLLTNGVPPGNEISDGPPLAPDTYFVGLYNPSSTPQTVYLLATLNGPTTITPPTQFSATNAAPITVDAVTNTSIYISNTNGTISSVNVGMVVQYPRISDLAFTLISPSGQRILLMENRGGPDATNAGGIFYITNSFATTSASGSLAATTNFYNIGVNEGTISISYDMYSIPDEMTVYYGTNPATFYSTSGDLLLDTGFVSNSGTNSVTFGPGTSTYITVIMNQNGNTNGTSDAWNYTVNGTVPDFNYLTFTDDTNVTTIPIKFATPPFDLRDLGTNYTFGNLDFATNGDYFGQTNIYDPFGGWTVPTNLVAVVNTNGVLITNNYNEVSVITDPGVAYLSNTNSTNYLALGYGIIERTNFVTPYRMITLSYAYRGPGIAGWWRGEGDAHDSSDAEFRGQNGSLIGRFDFPEGEVSQAFAMENNGGEYDFAGTNSYVQIRQQPVYTQVSTNSGPEAGSNLVTVQTSPLDVGTGPGFTVEGWINPTNLTFQQPLVEWLARVPTNGSDTNLFIRAGPFLDRATGHYYYMLGATNWPTSETWAEEIGGHLATVDTADEQNWIYDTFADYGGRSRNLWIGLTNSGGSLGYVSGVTNVSYFNWLTNQPVNTDTKRNYTFLYGNTNAYPGLWTAADSNGFVYGSTATNIVYGVVEVTNLQTNGVQFWISVTNVPGTNYLLTTNPGCLFANIVDVTNNSHWIFSAPGLVQSNVFQHVALTYDTNSGIANLFYNGTNVASTNLGVFIPKTTGDVLLGKDMSLATNNYYGGLMDEMSIYGRALSDAEIQAIYHVSASTTNRLIGKFNPAITPPESLAEAEIVLGGMTNVLLGENNTWQLGDFSFTAETNALPLQVIGLEPGMLFDDFSISQAPLGGLYYLPEQALSELNGESPNGNWTLEIWNTRNNTLATNAEILSWQLQMILQTNILPPVAIAPQAATPVTILPGQTITLAITPPSWASVATNTLISSTEPLNVYFNPTNPPTGSSPGDSFLFSGSTGSAAITTTSVPTNFVPGQTYYIGLQNTTSQAASAVFEVSYDITSLTNDVSYNDTLTNVTGTVRYFAFNVASTNAYEATFQLLHLSGNADLVVSKGTPLPTLTSSDYGSFNSGRADENIYVLTNSEPVPLTAGTWYLGVFNRDTNVVSYTVLAQELDLPLATTNSSTTNMTLIQLTNGVPFDYTAGPGAALTNFFYFVVTNTVTPTLTNNVGSIHFELYNLTGNGNLTVQTNAPPFAPPFFQSSDEPGTLPEFIQIQTNSALTNLAATWYLGVPNNSTNLIHFTILAVIDTNNFAAFPGAEGAGASTAGASFRNGFTNNTVYHVFKTNDDGSFGTLRDAVSSTNRTIVFDVSGVIYLSSPLTITNSYLSIEGQTAPPGGITLAGEPVIVTGAHDDVIRYLRLRLNYEPLTQDVYEADWSGDEDVYKFTPAGVKSLAVSGLSQPNGLAFDSSGNLFVDDWSSGDVTKITPSGTISTFATGMSGPWAIVINSAGNIFVSNENAGSITEITPGGVTSTFASGLPALWGLAFDSTGDLFTAAYGNGSIYEFKNNNGTLSTTPVLYASGVPACSGLAFNSAGDLFVGMGGSSNQIVEIKPGGAQSIYASGVNDPEGMGFSTAGDLFVAEGNASGGNNITEITPAGQLSTFASGLDSPGYVTLAAPAANGGVSGSAGNALQFNTASNIIADHVSITWSSNDDLSIQGSTNVTVQWSIISDSLHSTNTGSGGGSVVDSGNGSISLHHNLYADNAYANPQIGGNVSLDFVNNVVYGWGTNSGISEPDSSDTFTNYLNYVCNYVIAGANSLTNYAAFWGNTTNTWIFQTNNFIDSNTNSILDGANTGWNMFTNQYSRTNQFPLPLVTPDEAYLAYEKVLDFAGVDMFKRDPIDSNIVEKVRSQTGSIISSVGPLPTLSSTLIYQDTANDGIPDFWKITFGQAITNAENNAVIDGSGYSELEEYDNWLAAPHALTYTNMPVGVDLQKLFGKTGLLSFFATNAIHGQVYLTNVLGSYTNTSTFSNSIAVFTPTNNAGSGTNYSGYASLDVYVTNNNTFAYFPITVSVFISAVPPSYNMTGSLTNGATNVIIGNSIVWYQISVPTNAVAATNILLYAGLPMNLWYSTNVPPSTVSTNDFELLAASTAGSAVINIDGAPLPPRLVPGGTYYLGVQNTNNLSTNYSVAVNFDVPGGTNATPLPGGTLVTNTVPAHSTLYYAITVPPNAIAATNILDSITGGALNLWFNQTNDPSEANPPDYALLTAQTSGSSTIATNGTTPVLLPGQVYYLAVQNNNGVSENYTIEVNFRLAYSPPMLVAVSNQFVVAGTTLIVTNTATDTNAGSLFYSLTTTPTIVGPTISNNGVITWVVPTNEPATNVVFTATVTNAYTGETASDSFTVTVVPQLFANQPQTNTVAAGQIAYYAVVVPPNAIAATNTLTSTSGLLNLWFNQSNPPATFITPPDYVLLGGSGTAVLTTNGAAPLLEPGRTYYLGVRNTGGLPGAYTLEVTFDLAYSPPTLSGISNQTVVAGNTLVVTNTATDTNAGSLFYSLTTTPTIVGPTISNNGVITWVVPTNEPATNVLFTTVVSNSFTAGTATNSFNVTVIPILFSSQSQTNTVAAGSVNWFAVNVPTNAYWATNILLYATNLPVNVLFSANFPPVTNGAPILILNATNGDSVLGTNTAPARIVQGGTYYLGVQNTNTVSVNYALQVNFGFVQSPPATNIIVISSIVHTNIGGVNGFLLVWYAPTNDIFQVQETGSLPPPSWNTFTNIITYTGPVTPTNGMFTFFDNGSEYPFGPMRFYRLLLLQSGGSSSALMLAPLPNYVATVSQPFAVTNSATDSNSGAVLNFSLIESPTPSPAPTINAADGIINWTPVTADKGAAYKFTTVVTDNSSPSLAASNSFTVFVLPSPALSSAVVTSTNVTLKWTAPTNDLFQVEWTTNLTPVVVWTIFPTTITSSSGTFTFTDTNSPSARKFYRLLWLPLP